MLNRDLIDSEEASRVSVRTEFIAGLSTYLALSYIFLLNPVLLSKAGLKVKTTLRRKNR